MTRLYRRLMEPLLANARRRMIFFAGIALLLLAVVAATALLILSLAGGLIATAREARIAREQRARAEHRFNDVRKLANSLLFDVHDSIQNLPGATPARQMIVQSALTYLDSLAKESSGDPCSAELREVACDSGSACSGKSEGRA